MIPQLRSFVVDLILNLVPEVKEKLESLPDDRIISALRDELVKKKFNITTFEEEK